MKFAAKQLLLEPEEDQTGSENERTVGIEVDGSGGNTEGRKGAKTKDDENEKAHNWEYVPITLRSSGRQSYGLKLLVLTFFVTFCFGVAVKTLLDDPFYLREYGV